MALILKGSQSELILTRYGTLSINNEGMASLSREYSCATGYEATADALLAVDSAPLSYTLPSEVYNLVCTSVTKSRENGVTTYQANYIGLTTQVFKTIFGTSIESYSKSITTGSGNTAVTDQYTGTYTAPTVTKYSVAFSGATVPATPTSGHNVRILTSYKNGQPATPPSLTSEWLLTGLQSTQYGTFYIIEATGTRAITG
jgi:hypothetical protein